MKRFYYVQRRPGGTFHLHTGALVEGEKVLCGRRLTTDWSWVFPRPRRAPRCKQCLAAGDHS